MTKTEKELQTIEAKLKEDATKLEEAKKDFKANKEEFSKEMDERENKFKLDVEEAHTEFDKHMVKVNAELRSNIAPRETTAPISVFKSHGNTPKDAKK